jgi:hypothetical protein
MQPTQATVSLKYVMPLKRQYTTLHIDVGITDSAKSDESMDELFERVYKFVEDKLVEKVEQAQKELG